VEAESLHLLLDLRRIAQSLRIVTPVPTVVDRHAHWQRPAVVGGLIHAGHFRVTIQGQQQNYYQLVVGGYIG
jgi:hypothetical protein